jgi:hypothetical protein
LSRVPWRPVGWGTTATLLVLPFVAMQFTKDVYWTLGDFIAFGVMLLMVGVPLELAVRLSRNWSYRAAAAMALLGIFLTVWANLAVGIVGSEDNPANLLFFGALLIGIAGAVITKFRAPGMTIAAGATAVSLGIAFLIAASAPTDEPNVPHIRELIGTSVFAALFLGSALLFRKAAKQT